MGVKNYIQQRSLISNTNKIEKKLEWMGDKKKDNG